MTNFPEIPQSVLLLIPGVVAKTRRAIPVLCLNNGDLVVVSDHDSQEVRARLQLILDRVVFTVGGQSSFNAIRANFDEALLHYYPEMTAGRLPDSSPAGSPEFDSLPPAPVRPAHKARQHGGEKQENSPFPWISPDVLEIMPMQLAVETRAIPVGVNRDGAVHIVCDWAPFSPPEESEREEWQGEMPVGGLDPDETRDKLRFILNARDIVVCNNDPAWEAVLQDFDGALRYYYGFC